MGAILNRSSLQYIEFVNTPDYDSTVWVIDPDLSAVTAVPSIFWFINSDNSISEMTAAQKDTAYLASSIITAMNNSDNKRANILYGGFNYNGVVFDTDTQSITNIIGTQTLVNMGVTLPTDFVWRAADNSYQPFNNSTFSAFYGASSEWLTRVYGVSWYHKTNIAALTHYADVIAYDFTIGYPTGFSSGALTY